MTLIDALLALQDGCLPTNKQAISLLRNLAPNHSKRSDGTKDSSRLVSDLQTLTGDLIALIEARNGEEELQDFLWRTGGAAERVFRGSYSHDSDENKNVNGETTDFTRRKEKKGGTECFAGESLSLKPSRASSAIHHLRTLTRLFMIQPESRHIIADFSYIFTEVVDKTMVQTIAEARQHVGQVKSPEKTSQGIIHGAAGPTVARTSEISCKCHEGLAVKPKPAATLSEADASFPQERQIHEQRSSMGTSGSIEAGKAPASESEMQMRMPSISTAHVPSKDLGKGARIEGESGTNSVDFIDSAQMAPITSERLHLVPNATAIPLQRPVREAAKEASETWTKERRHRMSNRFKKLCMDCQASSDYKEAVNWFFGHTEKLVSSTIKTLDVSNTSMDKALDEASEPLIKLLENFSDGQSLRSILQTARLLSLRAKDNPTVVAFWTDVDTHLRRCLLEDGFVLVQEADGETRRLLKQFQALEQDYRDLISQLLRQSSDFAKAIRPDTYLLKVLDDFKQIGKSLFIAKDGSLLPSRQLWRELWTFVLPNILEKIGMLPIPRIKYLHPDFDIVIENIALELRHLLPTVLNIKMTNDVCFNFENISSTTHAHSLKVKMKGSSLRINELAFAFTSRLGLKFFDRGIADLLVAGLGLSIYLDIPKDPSPHCFVVRKVKVKLQTLQLKIRKSNHRILHAMAGALAGSYLTKLILRHFIAEGIELGLKQLDVQLMAARLKKKKEDKKGDIVDVKRQLAVLQDLLKKYREQAGTLEIDFKGMKGADVDGIGKSLERSQAVKWVKEQINESGRKVTIKDEWRSNAFDSDSASKAEGPPFLSPKDAAKKRREERPLGNTTQETVISADKEMRTAAMKEMPKRRQLQDPHYMQSKTGKKAVELGGRTDQIERLEKSVNRH